VNAALKSEEILQSMLDAHRADPEACPAPNTVSYNCVLHAWSRSPSPLAVDRAEKILHFMMASEDDLIAPDVYSFTSVLNALAKSKVPAKARKARDYLEKMLQMYTETKQKALQPTEVPFNAVLNSCAFSALDTPQDEQREAFKIAVETFALMKKLSVHPDMISFGNMLKAVANLVPKGNTRTQMGLQLFEACCQEGLVGDLVWKEARRALPAKVLSDMLHSKKSLASIRIQHLPKSWTRNVPKERRMHHDKPRKNQSQESKTKDPVEVKRKEPIQRFRNISEQSYQSGRDI
jgi:hypothetical protein